jgi:hypothetical protein
MERTKYFVNPLRLNLASSNNKFNNQLRHSGAGRNPETPPQTLDSGLRRNDMLKRVAFHDDNQ